MEESSPPPTPSLGRLARLWADRRFRRVVYALAAALLGGVLCELLPESWQPLCHSLAALLGAS